MRIRLRLALGIVSALALLLLAGWLARERLLDELARPWLERAAASRLEAEVRIGRLGLADGAVVVSDLAVSRPGRFDLLLPQAEARLSLSGVLRRRLDALRLVSPRLEIVPRQIPAAGGLPPRPPLTVGRLELSGGRLDYGTYRLHGLEVAAVAGRFEASTRLGEGDGLSLALRGRGDWEGELRLVLDRLAWGGTQLLAAPLTLTLPPDGPFGAAGTLAMARLESEQLRPALAALDLPFPLPEGWRFTLRSPQARFRLGEAGLALDLEAAGEVGSGRLTLPFAGVRLALAGAQGCWQGEGSVRLEGKTEGSLRGAYEKGRFAGRLTLAVSDPERLWRRLAGDGPHLAGGLAVEADLALQQGELSLRADLHGTPGERPAAFLLDLEPLAARVDLGARGGEASGTAELRLRGRKVLTARGSRQRLHLELLPLSLRELAAAAGPGLLPASLASEGITAAADLAREKDGAWGGEVRLAASSLSLPALAARDVVLAGRLRAAPAALSLRRARLAARLEGAGGGAKLAAAGEAGLEGRQWRLHLAELRLDEGEYLAADGLSGLAGGRLRGTLEAAGRLGEERVAVDLAARLGAGEVLKGAFYADLSALEGEIALQGAWDGRGRRLEAESLALALPGVADLRLTGTAGAGRAKARGRLVLPDLEQAFAGRLRQLLAPSLPALADLGLAGALAVDLAGEWEPDGWRLAGGLRPAGLAVRWPRAGLEVEGGGGLLPFDLRAGAAAGGAQAPAAAGELAFDRLAAGPATLETRLLHLIAAPNCWRLATPLTFTLAGGSLEAAGLAVALAGGEPELAAAVRLRDVDLEALTRRLGAFRLAGRVSADLGEVRYAGGVLSLPGTAAINAFGGGILVRGMRLEAPFSAYRTFHADLDFTGLDLAALTHAFAFGEVNGVADGHIHDLRLFGTVPSAFDARFETRERGRRNISVRALNNLSILSQGGLSAALSRGIYRFIDFYRYRKIGIVCTLRNDLFRLGGTARPGSERYLVDGGWLPPKIDIVVSSPAISFKEMLRRLQRLERAEGRAPAD